MADVPLSMCLGAGGPQPGVWAVGDSATSASCIWTLAAGSSVYALDIDHEAGLIAVGTRAGRIGVLPCPAGEALATQSPELAFVQGAPVLSVCLTGDQGLVASDTAGRCLLWRSDRPSEAPKALEGGEGVCSVVRAGRSILVGLSTAGRLVFWRLSDLAPVRMLECPGPPGRHALVSLVHWPALGAVVFACEGGRLGLCGIEDGALEVHQAHDGELYAVIEDGDCLYTIGREDGCMRVWRGSTPEERWSAPAGVISGSALANGSRQLLLVSDSGHAGIYSLSSDGLRSRGRVAGEHYRVAAGPRPEVRRDREEGRRRSRALELQAQIEACMRAGQTEDAEPLHRELVAMGYEATSLGLRAQSAAQRDDPIGELRARRHLARLLPPTDPLAAPSLERYIAALDAVWQFAEAKAVADGAGLDEPAEARTQRARLASALDGDDWVGEPDAPLHALIEASVVLERPFSGRWLLDVAQSVPLPDHDVGAEAVARKYEAVRAEEGQSGLPPATHRVLRWVSRSGERQTETLLFGRPTDAQDEARRLAVQVRRDGLGTVFVPTILFEAPAFSPERSIGEHNRRCLSACERAAEREAFDAWCQGVLRVLGRGLQRLRSLAVASRRMGSWTP